MPQVTTEVPTLPQNIKWLALQDLLRRRAQSVEHWKVRLTWIAVAIAFAIPWTNIVVNQLGARYGWNADEVRLASGKVVAVLALVGFVLEFAAQLIRHRAVRLNTISRRVLAAVMPADAVGDSPPEELYTRILEQLDIVSQEVTDWANLVDVDKEIDNKKRFGKWWASNRVAATGKRLPALLLDNVIWTRALLNKMAQNRARRRWVAIAFVIFFLLIVLMLTRNSLDRIVEFVVVPALLFAPALDGLYIIDHEIWEDSSDEIDDIYSALKGIDNRTDHNLLSNALLARYLGVTSAIPPISTKFYDEKLKELNEQVTHEALDKHLQGR